MTILYKEYSGLMLTNVPNHMFKVGCGLSVFGKQETEYGDGFIYYKLSQKGFRASGEKYSHDATHAYELIKFYTADRNTTFTSYNFCMTHDHDEFINLNPVITGLQKHIILLVGEGMTPEMVASYLLL